MIITFEGFDESRRAVSITKHRNDHGDIEAIRFLQDEHACMELVTNQMKSSRGVFSVTYNIVFSVQLNMVKVN